MSPPVTVVVPFRAGDPHREAAWSWVLDRYVERHPTWRVVRSDLDEGPWVKARAITAAAPRRGIVVVSDADVWTDAVGWAVRRLDEGARWVVPHRFVYRLAEEPTVEVLAGAEPEPTMELTRARYPGIVGGGVVVMRAETLRAVPPDPRFEGWGGEDVAWRDALRCLVGRETRGDGDLWHLYHPLEPRETHLGSVSNKDLALRYFRARRDPGAMRAILAEVGTVLTNAA